MDNCKNKIEFCWSFTDMLHAAVIICAVRTVQLIFWEHCYVKREVWAEHSLKVFTEGICFSCNYGGHKIDKVCKSVLLNKICTQGGHD